MLLGCVLTCCLQLPAQLLAADRIKRLQLTAGLSCPVLRVVGMMVAELPGAFTDADLQGRQSKANKTHTTIQFKKPA